MKTEELHEKLIATSIRMYSLYQAALVLCSVKKLDDLIGRLLSHCTTAMDVTSACLEIGDGVIYIRGTKLQEADKTYLSERLLPSADLFIHDRLPSGTPFLAVGIQTEDAMVGRLIVVNKEDGEFEPKDFVRMGELATITATALANVAEYQALTERSEKADGQLSFISQREAKQWGIDGFVGRSQTVKKILSEIRRLHNAGTVNVLITGESGTGKELIARAIHFGGPRSKHPFIPVNSSAIPSQLADSEFFGHVRGAFTGANRDRKGCFELADGGTLFLDEIGDMPLELQTKLLRVLEDGRFTPVGDTQHKQINVQIIAATNIDLQSKIAAGTFRQDFYYRLARFPVQIPSLRERREDIALLVDHFLKTFAEEMGIAVPRMNPQARETLEAYHFPGNIRELKNIIENALIRCDGGAITPEHLYLIPLSNRRRPHTENDAEPITDQPNRIHSPVKSHIPADTTLIEIPPRPLTEEDLILAYVKENDSISNTECRDFLNIDFNHASYVLRKMHKAGTLVRTGGRRWARYSLPC